MDFDGIEIHHVYLEVRKRRGAYIFLMKQVPVPVTYRR
jgi:hypothetical protein